MDAHVFNLEGFSYDGVSCVDSSCSQLDEALNILSESSHAPITHNDSGCIRQSAGAPIVAESASIQMSFDPINILVIGDFGEPNSYIQEVAALMNHVAVEKSPQLVIALGDNIYDVGCKTEDDPKFQTHWSDIFLKYESLRVPWKIALGNHDYGEDPRAQVNFTNSKKNPQGLWQCPNNVYEFSLDRRGISIHDDRRSDDRLVEFFCIDTNGSQGDVFNMRTEPYGTYLKYPNIKRELLIQVAELKHKLQKSQARWKVVYGHHPLHTKGRGHSVEALRLKNEYGLEDVFAEVGVDAYFAGHEHVFQHHQSRGVHHFVCGASCRRFFYRGADNSIPIDWYDESFSTGVVLLSIEWDRMEVKFLKSHTADLIKQVIITKGE